MRREPTVPYRLQRLLLERDDRQAANDRALALLADRLAMAQAALADDRRRTADEHFAKGLN